MAVQAVWAADPQAFRDGESCCCCDEIGFVQIYNSRYQISRGPDKDTGWRVDADGENKGGLWYPYGTDGVESKAKGVCEDPSKKIGMEDQPRLATKVPGLLWSSSLISWDWQAEVCVFCVSGIEGPVKFSYDPEFGTPKGSEIPGHKDSWIIGGGTKIAVYGCFSWSFSVTRENGRYRVQQNGPNENQPHLDWWADALTIDPIKF